MKEIMRIVNVNNVLAPSLFSGQYQVYTARKTYKDAPGH
jgi:hypothetical protein